MIKNIGLLSASSFDLENFGRVDSDKHTQKSLEHERKSLQTLEDIFNNELVIMVLYVFDSSQQRNAHSCSESIVSIKARLEHLSDDFFILNG